MKYTNIDLSRDVIRLRYIHGGSRQYAEIPVISNVFKPELFFEAKHGVWKSLYGSFLTRKEYNDIREFYNDCNKDGVFGTRNIIRQFVNKIKFEEMPLNLQDLRVIVIDIEVFAKNEFPEPNQAKHPVVLVQLYDINKKEIVVFGLKNFSSNLEFLENGIDFRYVRCVDEKDLLLKFVDYMKKDYPDIITGWNIDGFDLPYLIKRIENLFGKDVAMELSPWKEYKLFEVYDRQFHKKRLQAKISGISNLDYMQLYKKFSFKNVKSYGLDYVGNLELGIGKIDYDGNLMDLYEQDFDRFVSYGVRDIEIVKLLDDKFAFLSLVLSITYIAGCNHVDAFSPIKLWEGLVYRYLYRKKSVPPIETDENKNAQGIPGAYVHDPEPGMYEWVVSFDFNSLYPHLIMQFNISPETITTRGNFDFCSVVAGKKLDFDENECISGSGWKFRTDKNSIFAVIMKDLYKQRKDLKNKMIEVKKYYEENKGKISSSEEKELQNKISSYHSLQLALKVLLNSGYGAMSNPYFQYFDERLSSSITLSGQAAIKYIAKKLQEFFMKEFLYDPIVYMDTDSVYLQLKPIAEKLERKGMNDNQIVDIIADFCDGIVQKKIDEYMDIFAKCCGCKENLLKMKREKISKAGIWTAKKRYALHVIDEEGIRYSTPKLSITGLEIVRSTTPDWVAEKLNKVVEMLLEKESEENLVDFIVKTKSEFMKVSIDEIAQVMGITDFDKFVMSGGYVKGTPKHVKAAYNHNKYVKEKGMGLKLLGNGDKIKFIDLVGNPYGFETIGWDSNLSFPFDDLVKYIDRSSIWHKTFEKPVASLLQSIGIDDVANKLLRGNIEQKSLF